MNTTLFKFEARRGGGHVKDPPIRIPSWLLRIWEVGCQSQCAGVGKYEVLYEGDGKGGRWMASSR